MRKSKSTAIFLLSVCAPPIATEALCIGHLGKVTLRGVILATCWVGEAHEEQKMSPRVFPSLHRPFTIHRGDLLSPDAQPHLQPHSTGTIICAQIHDDLPKSFPSAPKPVSFNLNN